MGASAVRSIPKWKGLFNSVDMTVCQRLDKQASCFIDPVVNERFFRLSQSIAGSAETGGEKVENVDRISGDLAIDDQSFQHTEN